MSVPSNELQPIIGATLDDLNENLISEHIAIAERRRAYRASTELRDYLLRHQCLVDVEGNLTPTTLGILLFGRDPSAQLPQAGIDVVQFQSAQPNSMMMLLSRQLRGDIASIIDQATELLWARTEHRIVLRGTRRVEEDAYPMVALRELTANALLHRDWSLSGQRIRVQLFPDRIEWISPGGFPGRKKKISFEALLHEQFLRNPFLAQLLYNIGRVESFGMGLDSVAEALRDAPRVPVVNATADCFTITVWGKAVAESEPGALLALSERQQQILSLLRSGARPTQDLVEALEEVPRTVQRELRVLLDQGLIVAEGATRNRRYRLVRSEK